MKVKKIVCMIQLYTRQIIFKEHLGMNGTRDGMKVKKLAFIFTPSRVYVKGIKMMCLWMITNL